MSMTVVDKDIPTSRKVHGQFLTPPDVAKFCVDHIDTDADLLVEPSCGEGAFLTPISDKYPDRQLMAFEIDPALAALCPIPVNVQNFYDWGQNYMPAQKKIAFIGNPPYRSPALSLKDKNTFMTVLRKYYGVEGVREEAVLFILWCYCIAETNSLECEVHFILPKAIFQNNSKVFTKFKNFLNTKLGIRAVWDLGNDFDSVARNLVFVSMTSGPKSETLMLNGVPVPTDSWLNAGEGIIPFQKIFKKTYLGSVPCESVFLSCKGESREEFRDRLVNLFASDVTEDNVIELLSYKGEPHLRALKKGSKDKIKVVTDYVREAKSLVSDFSDINLYRPIRHRHEDRWYFRHDALKRASFVYQLNSNPGPSFSFPGNPSSSSKDYFVFCDYDINRNSGPGAQRCVPVNGLENNLTEWFQGYCRENGLPLNSVLEYLQWIGCSDWYKQTKARNERFYFGIPEKFDVRFIADRAR